MAKSMIGDTATKQEKIKQKSGLQRRNSTGGTDIIFKEQNPIPNYLRASIGSCHDLCKYGSRRASSAESSSGGQRRNRNVWSEAKSNTNKRGKKANETSKSTCNARASQNEESKRRASLPRVPESSVKIPISKIRRSKSVPKKVPKSEPKKLLESSVMISCKKTDQCETVAEKIIHVVEANDDGNQNEEKIDSAVNEHLCWRKQELKREEEVVETENKEGADGWKERRLRRVASEGNFDDKQKENCKRIVVISKCKVKALVDTFETLITTQDYRSSRERVRVHHKYTHDMTY